MSGIIIHKISRILREYNPKSLMNFISISFNLLELSEFCTFGEKNPGKNVKVNLQYVFFFQKINHL